MRIAISGKFCSGKTTAANLICSLDDRFVKISFADPIYELAEEFFGMKRENKDRDLLIHIGQTFREKDPDVWVKALIRRSEQLVKDGKFVVVDDMRLQNEFDALYGSGFHLMRLEVNPEIQEKRLKKLYPDTFTKHLEKRTHITETDLDREQRWDTVVPQTDTECDFNEIISINLHLGVRIFNSMQSAHVS